MKDDIAIVLLRIFTNIVSKNFEKQLIAIRQKRSIQWNDLKSMEYTQVNDCVTSPRRNRWDLYGLFIYLSIRFWQVFTNLFTTNTTLQYTPGSFLCHIFLFLKIFTYIITKLHKCRKKKISMPIFLNFLYM